MTCIIRYRNQFHPARLSSATIRGGELFVTVTVTDGAWKTPKQLHISHVTSFNIESNSGAKAAA